MYRPAALLALVAVVGCPASGGDKDPTGPDDPLEITTSSLPLAALGLAYSAGIDASGGDGDYFWDLQSGSLPPGLALSVEDLVQNDVVITGIPETEGSFSFVVRVTSGDDQTKTRGFTLTVLGEPAAITIETRVLPPALANAPYDTRLSAIGGDGGALTWTVESGTLPAGLTLETSGRLHGTPAGTDTTTVQIQVAGGGSETSRNFTLVVVANRTGSYDITIAPVVPIPPAFQAVVDAAVARWQAAITGDLPSRVLSTTTFDPGECGGFGPIVNGTSTDDLIVLVNIAVIDGPGQVLGFAGPCLIRSPGNLPIVGVLTLDAADLGNLNTQAQIALVTHEIGHVLGFGSLWDTFGLVTPGSADPRYTGSVGNQQWAALGGAGQAPVENEGGEGTARSHWRETTFGPELMTGFSNINSVQPMSRVTIGALADLGYTVNLNAADAFSLAPSMSASRDGHAHALFDLVYDGIVGSLDENGRLTPIQRGPR